MSGGLLALLDDVAAIAKVAAASVDDIAGQAAQAGAKATGIVIDDAAVTPRYVVGFAADRELPIIGKIALGSFKNKLLYLLPGGLLLNAAAPWLITPLLMLGGVYLCFEGYEKVHGLFFHAAHASAGHEAAESTAQDSKALEDEKVSGAITLASVATAGFWTQAAVLAAVGIGITIMVYGAVALIVKLDDLGLALSRRGGPVSKRLGQGIVKAMPSFLHWLSLIGTAAMLWVGGGIIIHGLAGYGLSGLELAIHGAAHWMADFVTILGGFLEWLVGAVFAGLLGLIVGFFSERLWRHAPQMKRASRA